MSIDEVESKLSAKSWAEKVAERKPLVPLDLNTQYRGNRVISRFYPEHWAKVQLARHAYLRYGVRNVAR